TQPTTGGTPITRKKFADTNIARASTTSDPYVVARDPQTASPPTGSSVVLESRTRRYSSYRKFVLTLFESVVGNGSSTTTSDWGSRTASGWRMTRSIRLKTARFAPMPSASVATAAALEIGGFRSSG